MLVEFLRHGNRTVLTFNDDVARGSFSRVRVRAIDSHVAVGNRPFRERDELTPAAFDERIEDLFRPEHATSLAAAQRRQLE